MRAFLGGAVVALAASSADAATLTYSFTANRASATPDNTAVTGVVDDLRGRATITGTLTIDRTLLATFPDQYLYAPPTILVDGADTTSGNARNASLVTRIDATSESVSTSYFGFTGPDATDIVSFLLFDFTRTLLGGDLSLPTSFTPLIPGATYLFDFQSVVFDGTAFSQEGTTYVITSLEPTPVPLPAAGLLLAAGVGVLAAAGRRRR